MASDEQDARRVIATIRRGLRPRIEGAPTSASGWLPGGAFSPSASRSTNELVARDLDTLRTRFDIREIPLSSHRKGLGWLVIAAKRLLRQLLTPILERQVAYNAANLRLVEALESHARTVMATVRAEIEQQCVELEQRIAALRSELERRPADSGPAMSAAEFDRLRFMERFRGSEAEVKQGYRRHLRHLTGRGPVLDVGCGRGELMELAREAAVEVLGVDPRPDLVARCREKGLDVAHGDVFEHLERVPDGSLGAIFSGHFVEHLSPADVIRLVRLCGAKLRPGGRLLVETVNPRCLTVLARSLSLDLSPVRPADPELLRFLFEANGLVDVAVDFLDPVSAAARLPHLDTAGPGLDVAAVNRCVDVINERLFGFQDFLIVGTRA